MDEWCDIPDALTKDDTAELSGYNSETIDRHIRAGRLKSVQTQEGIRIPKDWLIEFLYSHGYAIMRKSERHCGLLKRFFAEEN